MVLYAGMGERCGFMSGLDADDGAFRQSRLSGDGGTDFFCGGVGGDVDEVDTEAGEPPARSVAHHPEACHPGAAAADTDPVDQPCSERSEGSESVDSERPIMNMGGVPPVVTAAGRSGTGRPLAEPAFRALRRAIISASCRCESALFSTCRPRTKT